jgi:hypothetical protein
VVKADRGYFGWPMPLLSPKTDKPIKTKRMMRITPFRIYIIGQIKGLPLEEAKRNFKRIFDRLIAMGYEPINPFNLGIPDHWEYPQSRPHNLKALYGCEAVYIQSNWRHSDGSIDEIQQANDTNKGMFYEEKKGMEELEELSRGLWERKGLNQ